MTDTLFPAAKAPTTAKNSVGEGRAYQQIDREAQAAKALRESLAALIENDEGLALDMIEGETSLIECVDVLLEANTQDG